MKYILGVLLGFLVIASFVSAAPNIVVEETEKNIVLISEFGGEATYDLEINNLGESEVFEVYTLVGVRIEPSTTFTLPHGESKIEIRATPSEKILREQNGIFTYEYQIKGEESGIYKDKLKMQIVPLSNVLEISAEPLNLGENSATVIVRNTVQREIKDVKLTLESPFFEMEETLTLGANGEKRFEVPLNKESRGIVAGNYIMTGEVEFEDERADVEGVIDFVEKSSIVSSEEKEGFVSRQTTITRTNNGNVAAPTRVVVEKDIISRLFTLNQPEPTYTQREGLTVTYVWEETLEPEESMTFVSITNYTFPFVLLIIVVLVGAVVGYYQRKSVAVEKNVSFVRTRGGEFALKVKLRVKARKAVENVKLSDHLPHMTHLYESFGKKPDSFDKNAQHLSWNVGRLNRGEERAYSYIMYSKINVVGRFGLPQAHAHFSVDGKTETVASNRAFFAVEKGV